MAQSTVESRLRVVQKEVQMRKLNFTYSFRPIYYFSRALGLMPFSIEYDSNGVAQEPKLSKLDCLWAIISISIYSSLVYQVCSYVKIPENPSEISYFEVLSNILMSLILFCSIILIIGLNVCNRFRFVNILKSFTTFDNEVWMFYKFKVIASCFFVSNNHFSKYRLPFLECISTTRNIIVKLGSSAQW